MLINYEMSRTRHEFVILAIWTHKTGLCHKSILASISINFLSHKKLSLCFGSIRKDSLITCPNSDSGHLTQNNAYSAKIAE